MQKLKVKDAVECREDEVIAAAEDCLKRFYLVINLSLSLFLCNVCLSWLLSVMTLREWLFCFSQVQCNSSFSFLAALRTCAKLLTSLQVMSNSRLCSSIPPT